jgi:phosphoribosylformylglycinamidine synthase subunit PurL
LIRKGFVQSAHDCSEGGLLVTLAECCLTHPSAPLGATISLTQNRLRLDALLFGESPSRVFISIKPEHVKQVMEIVQHAGVPITAVGQVTSENMEVTVSDQQGQPVCRVQLSLADMADQWHHTLARQLGIEAL